MAAAAWTVPVLAACTAPEAWAPPAAAATPAPSTPETPIPTAITAARTRSWDIRVREVRTRCDMGYLTGDGDKDCASTDTNPTRRISATAEWDNPWYPYAPKPPNV